MRNFISVKPDLHIVVTIAQRACDSVLERVLTLCQPGGVESTPPPGFSLAIATKINRSTPNFLTSNFYYRDII